MHEKRTLINEETVRGKGTHYNLAPRIVRGKGTHYNLAPRTMRGKGTHYNLAPRKRQKFYHVVVSGLR